MLFPLGQVVATPGALHVLDEKNVDSRVLLGRHQAGDWGDVPPEDRRENELSVNQGFWILSSYPLDDDQPSGSLRRRTSANLRSRFARRETGDLESLDVARRHRTYRKRRRRGRCPRPRAAAGRCRRWQRRRQLSRRADRRRGRGMACKGYDAERLYASTGYKTLAP